MKILDEIGYDLDFRNPKVFADESMATLENVKAIVMISAEAITVHNGEKYVTVIGNDFVMKEIYEGRLTIEGKIRKIEFL